VFKWRVIVAAVVLLCARTLPGCGKSAEKVIQEERVPIEVAACETAGFGGEAVGPGEAEALHPGWGVGFGAGIDIEGESYCEKDAAGEEWLEAVDETVLLGGAKSDPEEVGAQ